MSIAEIIARVFLLLKHSEKRSQRWTESRTTPTLNNSSPRHMISCVSFSSTRATLGETKQHTQRGNKYQTKRTNQKTKHDKPRRISPTEWGRPWAATPEGGHPRQNGEDLGRSLRGSCGGVELLPAGRNPPEFRPPGTRQKDPKRKERGPEQTPRATPRSLLLPIGFLFQQSNETPRKPRP